MTRLTFGILYSQKCQTHANCRWKWLKQQNIFYVKLFLIKNSALIEFDVLRLDSAKNSRKIRWKIAFVRQRQVYMSLVKILVAENSMYILQILFENWFHPLSDELPSAFQNSHLFFPNELFIWSNYWRFSSKCTASSENSKFPTPLCLNCKSMCLNYMQRICIIARHMQNLVIF